MHYPPARCDEIIDPETAVRRIVAAAVLPFNERIPALQAIVVGLDADARRKVGDMLNEQRAAIAAEVGHDWTILDYEQAIAGTRLPRQWVEPGSRRRAVERINEVVAQGALRDDDTLGRLSLVACAGDRLRTMGARIRDAHDLIESHKDDRVWVGRPAAQKVLADAETAYNNVVRSVLKSPEFRQHLSEATAIRNRAAAEYARLKKWLDAHDEESMQILGVTSKDETAPAARRSLDDGEQVPETSGFLPPPEEDGDDV